MITKKQIYDDTDEKILTALCSISAQVMFNIFALENVVLHNIKPSDVIPFEQYIIALNMERTEQFILRSAIQGKVIDENKRIADKPIEEYYHQFYIEQIDKLFPKAPKKKSDIGAFEMPLYKHGLKEYFESLYALYIEILQTEVHPELYDLLSDIADQKEQLFNRTMIIRFVTAIKTKNLRQGSRIDRYIKPIKFLPEQIKRLIRTYHGNYLLANSNTDSLDYKLALLSCFHFCTVENEKLFECKMRRWERNHYKTQN